MGASSEPHRAGRRECGELGEGVEILASGCVLCSCSPSPLLIPLKAGLSISKGIWAVPQNSHPFPNPHATSPGSAASTPHSAHANTGWTLGASSMSPREEVGREGITLRLAHPLKRSDHSAETLCKPKGALKPDQGHP